MNQLLNKLTGTKFRAECNKTFLNLHSSKVHHIELLNVSTLNNSMKLAVE